MICSVELPVKYLKEYSERFDFDFVIASTCLEFPEYFEYFKSHSRFMILDNGAFETGASIDIEKYYKIIQTLKPEIVVLPDVFKDEVKTMQLSYSFIKFWKRNKISNIELMGVLPGETPTRLLSNHYFFNQEGVKWFGLPYGNMIDRFQFLKSHPEIENVHILGLPSLNEVLSLNLLSNVKSIDSSLPVKCTAEDKFISKVLTSNCKVTPQIVNLNEDKLKYNLDFFSAVCHDECIILRK